MRAGGALDAEAAARGTTVYLVDQRLDMLPALLSEDLCSLRGGRDRLAVSVMWTLGPDLDPRGPMAMKPWFGRSIVRSSRQLAYQQVCARWKKQGRRCGMGTCVRVSFSWVHSRVCFSFRIRKISYSTHSWD